MDEIFPFAIHVEFIFYALTTSLCFGVELISGRPTDNCQPQSPAMDGEEVRAPGWSWPLVESFEILLTIFGQRRMDSGYLNLIIQDQPEESEWARH